MQPQAGGTDLADGGAEGPAAAAETRAALAERRLMRVAAAGMPEPCLVLQSEDLYAPQFLPLLRF